MANSANFAQVDDYIASQLGTTLPSAHNSGPPPHPADDFPISPSFAPTSPPMVFTPSPNPSHTSAAAHEYQSLQLKLKDALILLDQYKVQVQQQQHRISELQQAAHASATSSSSTAASASSLDPEVHYLQQHVITLGGRIEALESLNSSLQGDINTLAVELGASREEVMGLRREGVLSSKHAEQLVQLCSQYKAELSHWLQEHEQLQACLAAKDQELEAAQARIATLERDGEILRAVARENAADVEHRMELERQVVEATQAHAATVGRLRNEAMLATQLSEELRAELEYSGELHKVEVSSLAARHESDVTRLQAELVATRSAAAAELEAVQEHYTMALRALQQQFEQYQGAAEATVGELGDEYERELAEVRARYRNECLLMSAWAQQSVQAVALAKDARMAALLDSSSTEALVRGQQEELARLAELHERQLAEARVAAAQQSARELYSLKRRLGAAQLEASHQQASNRALHGRVTALCTQLAQSSQALAASKREQQQAAARASAEAEAARVETQRQTERAEKLQHECLRLKLALEGRLKGSASASAVRLQHALQTLESEVATLRSELQMRAAQVQHAVAAGERAAGRARELEKQLGVARREYSRVLGLLGGRQDRQGLAAGDIAEKREGEGGEGAEQEAVAVAGVSVRVDMLGAREAAEAGRELGVDVRETQSTKGENCGKGADADKDGPGPHDGRVDAAPELDPPSDAQGRATHAAQPTTPSVQAPASSLSPSTPRGPTQTPATAGSIGPGGEQAVPAAYAEEYPDPPAALVAAAPESVVATAQHATLSSLQQQLQDELTSGLRALRAFRTRSHLARKDQPLQALLAHAATPSAAPVASPPAPSGAGAAAGTLARAGVRRAAATAQAADNVPSHARGTLPSASAAAGAVAEGRVGAGLSASAGSPFDSTQAYTDADALRADEEILYDVRVRRHTLPMGAAHAHAHDEAASPPMPGSVAPPYRHAQAHTSFRPRQGPSPASATGVGAGTGTGAVRTRVTVRPSRVRLGLASTRAVPTGADTVDTAGSTVHTVNGLEVVPRAPHAVAAPGVGGAPAPGPSRRPLRVATGPDAGASTPVRPTSGTPARARSYTPQKPPAGMDGSSVLASRGANDASALINAHTAEGSGVDLGSAPGATVYSGEIDDGWAGYGDVSHGSANEDSVGEQSSARAGATPWFEQY